MPELNTYKRATLKNILWIGLLVGTLDGVAALLLNYKIGPAVIFRFIASGVYGKAAYAGAEEMIVAGVFFHYLIAYAFTAVFYLLYPYAYSLFKNKYVIAIVYGGAAWLIMNLIVVPLSQIGPHHIKPVDIIIGVCILIACVGLPTALAADRKLTKRF